MKRKREKKRRGRGRGRRRRGRKRRSQERSGTLYDFVWKLLGYGFLDLCMVIGLFHL